MSASTRIDDKPPVRWAVTPALLLAALIALALAPLQPSLVAQPPKALSLLVVGDWGRISDNRQRDVADQMAKADATHGAVRHLDTTKGFRPPPAPAPGPC